MSHGPTNRRPPPAVAVVVSVGVALAAVALAGCSASPAGGNGSLAASAASTKPTTPTTAPSPPTTSPPTIDVAKVFAARNPAAEWHAVMSTVTLPVDGAKVQFQIFAPSTYSRLGTASPIIAWGNGTGAAPTNEYYSDLLDHFVSWGFTVISPNLPNTGSGVQMVAGARYLVAEDRRKGSRFFQHLDTTEIAAVGHSQGAFGAVQAAVRAPHLFTTVMTFSLPWNGQGPAHSYFSDNSQYPHGWVSPNPDCPTWQDCWIDPGRLTQPAFLISTHGTLDGAIAPPGVEQCYLQHLSSSSVMGVIKDSPPGSTNAADHNTLQNTSHGGQPSGLWGYATAWLIYRLRHDLEAGEAFTSSRPQLLSNPDWPGSDVPGARGDPPRADCDESVPGVPTAAAGA